jgi:hypothetical protein
MKVGRTQRGFEMIEFKDRYKVGCSLQQSSLATEEAVWLGVNDADPKIMASDGSGWEPYKIPDDVSMITRMHLTKPMVKELIVHLQRWLDTNSFKD